jgi:hypothetical protein
MFDTIYWRGGEAVEQEEDNKTLLACAAEHKNTP